MMVMMIMTAAALVIVVMMMLMVVIMAATALVIMVVVMMLMLLVVIVAAAALAVMVVVMMFIMRIACPPLIYACPFVGFSASKNALELITRRIIKELEGDEDKNLEKYATTGSPEYEKMVSIIAERFGLTSLKFNTLETLIEAIGLPKCKVCTHCFDGSSHF